MSAGWDELEWHIDDATQFWAGESLVSISAPSDGQRASSRLSLQGPRWKGTLWRGPESKLLRYELELELTSLLSSLLLSLLTRLSELEDILRIPKRPTLDQLDRSMCTCIKFCAEYHCQSILPPSPPSLPSAVLLQLTPRSLSPPDDYLLAPIQLDRALDMILASVLFKFHSTRMLDLIVKEATKVSLSSSSLSSLLSSRAHLRLASRTRTPLFTASTSSTRC